MFRTIDQRSIISQTMASILNHFILCLALFALLCKQVSFPIHGTVHAVCAVSDGVLWQTSSTYRNTAPHLLLFFRRGWGSACLTGSRQVSSTVTAIIFYVFLPWINKSGNRKSGLFSAQSIHSRQIFRRCYPIKLTTYLCGISD